MSCDKVPTNNKPIMVNDFCFDHKCIKRKGHKGMCMMSIDINWWGK